LKKFYGNGSYDTNKTLNAIVEAESAVKIRDNTTTYSCRGSWRRRQEVRKYIELGYKKRVKKDNKLWPSMAYRRFIFFYKYEVR